MINLTAHEARLQNLNTRVERHGDERVLSADIKIETKAGNELLDSLEPGLRQTIFRPANKGEQLALVGGNDALVAVKHPCLEPLRINHEFEGYELQILGLLDGIEPLLLVDVKLKKFTIAPIEGGSVQITFTASANVDADELGELSEALIREDVRVTLTPPDKQEQPAALAA